MRFFENWFNLKELKIDCVSYASFSQVSVTQKPQFFVFAPQMRLKEKGIRYNLTP
jgi:hypothetical protein